MNPWEDLFGEVPSSFEDRVQATLTELEEQPVNMDTIKKKARPVYRTLLIAAAVAALLIGTALAVYQITIQDTLTGERYTQKIKVWDDEASGEPEYFEVERLKMSLNGLPDSPEYKAAVEWTEWNTAWQEENPDPRAELGVDDSWHETPDNYAYFYGASFNEQAEKLDEIAEKYGLKLHTVRAPLETEEELCAVLGVSELAADIVKGIDGTVYEDGSFLFSAVLQEDPEVRVEMCLAVKGSLRLFRGFIDADYEEWSYTTVNGTPVALALADVSAYPDMWLDPTDAWLVAQFDEALFSVSFRGIEDRAQLEAFADRLNLAGLAARFSAGSDRSDIPAAAAAQQTAFQEAQAAQIAEEERRIEEQEAYVNQHTSDEWGELLREELGDYSLPDTLEGQHYMGFGLSVSPTMHAIVTTYSDDDYEGWMRSAATYEFLYERDWSDETQTQSTTREEFEERIRSLEEDDAVLEVMDIGGYKVYVCGAGVTWYDAERDLQFSIADCHPAFDPNPFTQEQIVGLAESFIGSLGRE